MEDVKAVFNSKYKWTFSRFFEICGWEKFKYRCFLLYVLCLPEVFLGGALWEGMGYACNCNIDSASYFFSTGFGGGLGALVGHLITSITLSDDGYPIIPRIEIFHSIAYFFAILLGSGTTWQRICNDTKDYNMTFTESFFFMWTMSGLLFLSMITVLRILNNQLYNIFFKEEEYYFPDRVKMKKRFLYDVQLAMGIGLADAFFVGTEGGFYTDNWLGHWFAVYPDTPVWKAMLLSGTCCTMGFLLCQNLQNIISKDNWIDHLIEEPEPENFLHRMSELSLLVVPQPEINRQSLVGRMSLTAMPASFKARGSIVSPRPQHHHHNQNNNNSPLSLHRPSAFFGSRSGSMSSLGKDLPKQAPAISVDYEVSGQEGSITPFAAAMLQGFHKEHVSSNNVPAPTPTETVSPLQQAGSIELSPDGSPV